MNQPKVVILAGGLGTRLSEETTVKPKPMVEIGDQPILWHIMKCYAHFGFLDFTVALGYKGDLIKRYFLDYYHLSSDMTIKLASGEVDIGKRPVEDWDVHLIDTGLSTNTGGRIRRLRERLDGGTFMVTYGDGVSDVDIGKLLAFHRSHGKIATVTAVRPPARFGGLVFDGDQVVEFTEKPQIGEGWINGGFMVLEPELFDYLDEDSDSLESKALETLASEGELMAYRHDGYWQCMDTVRELQLLRKSWASPTPPWKHW